MIEKTFLNPTTNKQWRIEIDGHTIRTCLNGGKVKEILCDSAFQVRSKAASAMMGQMRKGFVYQNRDAAVGQARCHRFVGKDSNGFMPLAASPARDDFFLTRVVGDFEDETLYHFDGSGESLETVSLGAKRMTYEQVLCPNNTLLLNNSYLLQQFSLRTHEVTPFANKKNSMKAMLDQSGDLTLWYTGEEIVVFAFGSNTKVWRETVKCKKSKDPNFAYYCFGIDRFEVDPAEALQPVCAPFIQPGDYSWCIHVREQMVERYGTAEQLEEYRRQAELLGTPEHKAKNWMGSMLFHLSHANDVDHAWASSRTKEELDQVVEPFVQAKRQTGQWTQEDEAGYQLYQQETDPKKRTFRVWYLIANPRGLPKEFVQKELEFRWKLFPEKKEETK